MTGRYPWSSVFAHNLTYFGDRVETLTQIPPDCDLVQPYRRASLDNTCPLIYLRELCVERRSRTHLLASNSMNYSQHSYLVNDRLELRLLNVVVISNPIGILKDINVIFGVQADFEYIFLEIRSPKLLGLIPC